MKCNIVFSDISGFYKTKRSERKYRFFHSFPVMTLIIPLYLKSINRLSNASRLISILFYIFAPIRIFIDYKCNQLLR